MIPTPLKDINQSFNLIIDLPAFIFFYKFKMMTLTFQEHFKFTKMGELVIFFFFLIMGTFFCIYSRAAIFTISIDFTLLW